MVVLSSNEESLGKPAGIRMGRRIKVLAFISAGTATLGGAALLLFLTEVYSPLNWQKIAASLLLITGILLAFILFLLKNTAFRDRRKLFYAVLINPILASILAGATGLMTQDANLRYVYIISGIGMVLCVIIGCFLLLAAFWRNR